MYPRMSPQVMLSHKRRVTTLISSRQRPWEREHVPVLCVTYERLILEVGLDMRVDRALPREMTFTTLDQAFESLHRLSRH